MSSHEFVLRSVADVVTISIIKFVVSAAAAKKLQTLMHRYDENSTTCVNLVHLISNVAFIAGLVYVIRKMSKLLPLPFGSNMPDVTKDTEIKGSAITNFAVFLFLGDSLREFKPLFDRLDILDVTRESE